jgi:Tfp pilus assembly protein PilN
MLNLNLLPPDEKTNLAYEFRTRAVLRVGLLLLACLSIAGTLFLPTMFLLSFQKTEVARTLELEHLREERSGIRDEVARVKEVNQEADVVTQNLTTRRTSSDLLTGLLGAIPAGISLSDVTYMSSSNAVLIAGFAPTRALFLVFLDSLRKDARVTEVASPVSNVIRDTDITFSITITLRPPA